jgi:hypothetical protein
MIKLSELLSNKQIDALYLKTIYNPMRREEIRKLLEGMIICSTRKTK